MDLKQAIYTRRSVREFSTEPVDQEALRDLIDAAVQAPSAVNQQPWSFCVVRDKAKFIRDEVEPRYSEPFMKVVSALPRQDLAKFAEALVSLTVFLKRMSADQDETVAEPIDVAVISKGDGFVWVKHKDLIGQTGGYAI